MTIDIQLDEKKPAKIVLPKRSEKQDKPQTIETKKKKKWPIFVILGIILVVLGGLGFLVYKGYEFTKNLGFNFNAGDIITPQKDPELAKDSTGKYTNILIVGVDTREKTELLNTDTIIVLSYNHESNDVVMVSLPRDLNVGINGNTWFNRINSVYASAENKAKGSGMTALKKTIAEVTGIEIQYHAMVNFKAFVDIVDAVGGVDINVENSFTDYRYPDGYSYKKISFTAGPQTMDGQTALEYARSRKSQDNNEGSDYSRAKRQQKVIVALQEKILNTSTLTNPKAIMEIFASVANNIKVSEFTIDDIQAGLNVAKDFQENNGKTYSFVLDPTAGNYSLIQVKIKADGAYGIQPKLGLGQYTDIKKYVQLCLLHPQLYTEEASVYVYNVGLGAQEASKKVADLKKAYPYLKITYSGTRYSNKEDSAIYSNTPNTYLRTVTEYAKFLGITQTTKPDYITNNLNGGNVTILLGKPVQLSSE